MKARIRIKIEIYKNHWKELLVKIKDRDACCTIQKHFFYIYKKERREWRWDRNCVR